MAPLSIWKKAFLLTSLISVLLISVILIYLKKSGSLKAIFFRSKAEIVYDSCMFMMSRKSCAIMNNAVIIPSDVKQIYLPNYGSLSADVYRLLISRDIGMCEVIRDKCSEDISTEECKIGLTIYNVR